MKISLVLNTDTRHGYTDEVTSFQLHNHGCRHKDFLTDGVVNKKKFLTGFDFETIVFVDEHNKVPHDILDQLHNEAEVVVIKRHNINYKNHINWNYFNDLNYLQALQLAQGDIILHADQDTALFTNHPDFVQQVFDLLETYQFISYPSHWSPEPVHDPTFHHRWVSTRFFITKNNLDYTEIEKCLTDNDYLYNKYNHTGRRCGWLEHVLGIMAGIDQVFYLPQELNKRAIFCWDRYRSGLLKKLNEGSYNNMINYVISCQGIHYPCDLTAQ